jgi:hypothetical protein
MSSLKPIFDLLAKMNRNNKDRQIGNDILEMTRQMKGVEKNLNDLFNNRVASGLEIERLKQEISKLKKAAGIPSGKSWDPPEPAAIPPKVEPKAQQSSKVEQPASFLGMWPEEKK